MVETRIWQTRRIENFHRVYHPGFPRAHIKPAWGLPQVPVGVAALNVLAWHPVNCVIRPGKDHPSIVRAFPRGMEVSFPTDRRLFFSEWLANGRAGMVTIGRGNEIAGYGLVVGREPSIGAQVEHLIGSLEAPALIDWVSRDDAMRQTGGERKVNAADLFPGSIVYEVWGVTRPGGNGGVRISEERQKYLLGARADSPYRKQALAGQVFFRLSDGMADVFVLNAPQCASQEITLVHQGQIRVRDGVAEAEGIKVTLKTRNKAAPEIEPIEIEDLIRPFSRELQVDGKTGFGYSGIRFKLWNPPERNLFEAGKLQAFGFFGGVSVIWQSDQAEAALAKKCWEVRFSPDGTVIDGAGQPVLYQERPLNIHDFSGRTGRYVYLNFWKLCVEAREHKPLTSPVTEIFDPFKNRGRGYVNADCEDSSIANVIGIVSLPGTFNEDGLLQIDWAGKTHAVPFFSTDSLQPTEQAKPEVFAVAVRGALPIGAISHTTLSSTRGKSFARLLLETGKQNALIALGWHHQKETIASILAAEGAFHPPIMLSYILRRNARNTYKEMTNDEIVLLVNEVKFGDPKAEELLLFFFDSMIRTIAAKHSPKTHGIAFDDLCQEGKIYLLWIAKAKFDVSYGREFKRYAWQGVEMKIRALVFRNRNAVRRGKTWEDLSMADSVRNVLRHKNMREPTRREISDALGIALEELDQLLVAAGKVDSFDAPVCEGDERVLLDTAAGRGQTPLGMVEEAQRRAVILAAIHHSGLTEKEKSLLKARFFSIKERTYADIAREAGVSRETIRNRAMSAMGKLKGGSFASQLQTFYEDAE